MGFVCSIVASASFQVKKKNFQMETNILYSNQKFAYYLYVMTKWVSDFFNQNLQQTSNQIVSIFLRLKCV
jgi:hypothetical protein